MLVADCCLAVAAYRASSPDGARYSAVHATEFADPAHAYFFLYTPLTVEPQLVLEKHEPDGTVAYLFEIFDTALPRYRLRNKLTRYAEYLCGDRETAGAVPSSVLLVCPGLAELRYAKRRMRLLLEDRRAHGTAEVLFTTKGKLKERSIVREI